MFLVHVYVVAIKQKIKVDEERQQLQERTSGKIISAVNNSSTLLYRGIK